MTFPTEWKVLKFHGSSHHQPEIHSNTHHTSPSGRTWTRVQLGSNASGSGHRMDWTANGPLHPMMFDEDYYYPSGNLNVVYWKIYQ